MSTVLTCVLALMYASSVAMILPMLTVAAAAATAVVDFWMLASNSINAVISAASSRRCSQTNGGATPDASSSSSHPEKSAGSKCTPSGIGRGRLDGSKSGLLVSPGTDTVIVFYECEEPRPDEMLSTCNQVS
jgi:hypothetical protein